ncbi:MAG TPA: polysaccharide biosynthesis tyrosine autokinase [Mycobacteriales bacterium]|nr:polysaccharide biosynthesis tyrosine autokinase [Mycobacteriales bacterium]
MDLGDYIRLLRIHRTLIILCTLLGIAAAAAITLAATPIYSARARLFVSADEGSGVGAVQGSQFAQQRVKSYADIIDSPVVAQAVIDELGLSETPEELAARLAASAPVDTVLLNISATDRSPVQAQRIANSAADNFTKLVSQLERTNASGQPLVKITVVKPAEFPTTPVSPRRNVNLALGLLVGLGIGIGIAVARETLDTSVKGAEELQEQFDLPTLGVISYDGNASRRPLVVQDSPGAPRAEAFRQIRTNLQFINVDDHPRSIVVTSSVPGEGKSTTTCNLAITIAEFGAPVILIEGDLRRPKVGEYLGLVSPVGLTDILIGRVSVDEALQDWGDGTMKVLLSGRQPPNPSELLGSRQMTDLLHELESRALVIIDSPPLLPVTDAAVLSARASGALLVVRASRTRREQVKQAVESLRGVDATLFGAVFNMAPAKGPDAYRYGYGYGYGYEASASGDAAIPGQYHGLSPTEAAIAAAAPPAPWRSAPPITVQVQRAPTAPPAPTDYFGSESPY